MLQSEIHIKLSDWCNLDFSVASIYFSDRQSAIIGLSESTCLLSYQQCFTAEFQCTENMFFKV